MSMYRVNYGESPALIARKLGTSVPALFAANPHKPTTVVGGKRTWQTLSRNENLRVPGHVGSLGDGMLGAIAPAATNAPHALIKEGNSGPDVALWQMIIGVTADGIFGKNTAAATKAWQSKHGLAADGIVGPKSWTAALQGAIPAAAPPPSSGAPPAPIPAVSSGGQPTIRQGSKGAPVKQWQAIIGVAQDGDFGTQTAAATKVWQAAHGLTADGIVGPQTWAAAAAPGAAVAVPAAAAMIPASFQLPQLPDFGLTPATTTVFAPPPPPASFPVPGIVPLPSAPAVPTAPTVTSVAVPLAIQALASIDPCDPANAQLVCQAQLALGFKVGAGVDGKYGADAAAAARKYIPNAPPGCSPRPTWWAPKGQSNCGGSLSLPSAPAPSASSVPSVPVQQPTAALPVVPGSAQPVIVAPIEDKKISTGAVVAGAVGLAALVGLVAVAASGKKSTSRSTTTVTRRAPARKSAHKKPAHKKK